MYEIVKRLDNNIIVNVDGKLFMLPKQVENLLPTDLKFSINKNGVLKLDLKIPYYILDENELTTGIENFSIAKSKKPIENISNSIDSAYKVSFKFIGKRKNFFAINFIKDTLKEFEFFKDKLFKDYSEISNKFYETIINLNKNRKDEVWSSEEIPSDDANITKIKVICSQLKEEKKYIHEFIFSIKLYNIY